MRNFFPYLINRTWKQKANGEKWTKRNRRAMMTRNRKSQCSIRIPRIVLISTVASCNLRMHKRPYERKKKTICLVPVDDDCATHLKQTRLSSPNTITQAPFYVQNNAFLLYAFKSTTYKYIFSFNFFFFFFDFVAFVAKYVFNGELMSNE